MDETDGLGAAKKFCVSEPLLEGSNDGSCGWETNPTCQFAWCGNNEQIGVGDCKRRCFHCWMIVSWRHNCSVKIV